MRARPAHAGVHRRLPCSERDHRRCWMRRSGSRASSPAWCATSTSARLAPGARGSSWLPGHSATLLPSSWAPPIACARRSALSRDGAQARAAGRGAHAQLARGAALPATVFATAPFGMAFFDRDCATCASTTGWRRSMACRRTDRSVAGRREVIPRARGRARRRADDCRVCSRRASPPAFRGGGTTAAVPDQRLPDPDRTASWCRPAARGRRDGAARGRARARPAARARARGAPGSRGRQPRQGRVPRDARARAAQPARADSDRAAPDGRAGRRGRRASAR